MASNQEKTSSRLWHKHLPQHLYEKSSNSWGLATFSGTTRGTMHMLLFPSLPSPGKLDRCLPMLWRASESCSPSLCQSSHSPPWENRPYPFFIDASLGKDLHPGGFGAILIQLDKNCQHQALAHASQKLEKHKQNYTPYLLVMQAVLWGMDHFSLYTSLWRNLERCLPRLTIGSRRPWISTIFRLLKEGNWNANQLPASKHGCLHHQW